MIRRIPVFQQGAVCLTKFGPESGETAKEILARKELERRSGTRSHRNEFWWGIGQKGTAQSVLPNEAMKFIETARSNFEITYSRVGYCAACRCLSIATACSCATSHFCTLARR
jgi:hypothetical protein